MCLSFSAFSQTTPKVYVLNTDCLIAANGKKGMVDNPYYVAYITKDLVIMYDKQDVAVTKLPYTDWYVMKDGSKTYYNEYTKNWINVNLKTNILKFAYTGIEYTSFIDLEKTKVFKEKLLQE